MTSKITLKKIRTHSRQESLYVVSVDGREVGCIGKFKNTRSNEYPWTAWRGIGSQSKLAGHFYPADGGKDAAIAAVTK